MPTLDAYIDVEEALINRLSAIWRPIALRLFGQIRRKIKDADFDGARDLAAQLDLSSVGEKNREFIRYSMFAAANVGAELAADGRGVRSQKRRYDRLVNRVTQTFLLGLENNATLAVYRQVVQSIAQAEAEYAKTQKADVPRFVQEFVSFTEAGDQALQLTSALHTNRLAVWGFTAEAEVRGIVRYQLQATLDDRTSAFCEMIDGRVFEVVDAADKVREALNAGSPDDLKSIQPWPAQDAASIAEYEGMSSDELMDLGLHIPPFHPYCRTLLIPVDEGSDQNQAQNYGEADDEHDFVATADSFAELGADVDPADLDWWNVNVGADPVGVLSDISGIPGDQLLGDVPARVKIRDGDAVFAVAAPAGNGQARLQQVFDPFTGRLFQTLADFKDASPAAVGAFLQQMFARAPDVAARLGAAELMMGASGAGGYALASLGFAPSVDDWQAIRAGLTKDYKAGEIPELDQLSAAERQVVADLLDNQDPQAAIVLADLPYTVAGVPIGQILLSRKSYQAILDFEDPLVMAQFGEYVEDLAP